MKKKIFAPATKEDLVQLGQSMKDDLDEAVVSLRRDLEARSGSMATKKDLESMATKTDLFDLDRRVDVRFSRMANGIVNTQAELRELKSIIATKADIDRILSAVDDFTGRVRNCESGMLFNGRGLTSVQDGLKEHEKRIAALEARPGS